MGILGKLGRRGLRAMRHRSTAELPPYSVVRTGNADPSMEQAQDWLMLAGSPEKALQFADEELRFFRSMGDQETVAKMEGAANYLRMMLGSSGGMA